MRSPGAQHLLKIMSKSRELLSAPKEFRWSGCASCVPAEQLLQAALLRRDRARIEWLPHRDDRNAWLRRKTHCRWRRARLPATQMEQLSSSESLLVVEFLP